MTNISFIHKHKNNNISKKFVKALIQLIFYSWMIFLIKLSYI